MKKLWIVLLCALCLAGCGAVKNLETIADDLQFDEATAAQVEIALPQDSETVLLSGDSGDRLYLCEDYTVAVQTLSGGDLNRSLQTVTGFDKDSLTLMKTEQGGVITYSCVWSAVGEGEDQVCRAVILDDGEYHYAVTVMADYTQAADLADVWQQVLGSVELSID
jgi:hypothetical protein